MKKASFAKTITTILLLSEGLALFSGLTSCENFFKGSEVKREIEEQIAYANARECTLLVKSDDALGSFLSANEKKCKVGYSIQLQFTANTKNYSFEGLEAVSTGGESREDYVSFELCESDVGSVVVDADIRPNFGTVQKVCSCPVRCTDVGNDKTIGMDRCRNERVLSVFRKFEEKPEPLRYGVL